MQVVNVKIQNLRKLGYKNLEEWLSNKDNIYIGRNVRYVNGATQSKWANPFPVKQYTRDGCLTKYREYILSNKELMDSLSELKGKNLGCWCQPEKCHGDILIELLNGI